MIHLLVLGAVLAIATVYVGVHIGKGWVPADDGILGQSALRVMQGSFRIGILPRSTRAA